MGDAEARSDFPDARQRRAFCQSQWDEPRNNSIHAFRSDSIGPTDRDGVRHAVFEGRDHLVVPIVMICEGVLNGALVPESEFGRYAESWNGRPVPVLHPEREGTPVSANQPDIIERNTIGMVFNAYARDGKLKAEAWIDTDKASRLGHNALLEALESGQCVEVSTGYFADSEMKQGSWGDKAYSEIHRNIRPDHLALLPGEVGACSIQDGCGTRVNSTGFLMNANKALETLAQALGLRANTTEGGTMSESKLMNNAMLTPEQLEMLQGMDSEQLTMVEAIVEKLTEKAEGEEAPAEEMPAEPGMAEAEDKEQMNRMSEQDLEKVVANRVDEAIRRRETKSKLTANAACPFSETELDEMPVTHLEKLEKSIRPADYSGQGGFAANSDALETEVTPLVPAANRKKEG